MLTPASRPTDVEPPDPAGKSVAWFTRHILPPLLAFVLIIGGWELLVRASQVPSYLFPKPSDIVGATIKNWSNLMVSASTTIFESITGFAMSVVLGVGIAVLLSFSRVVEKSFYPYAIIQPTAGLVLAPGALGNTTTFNYGGSAGIGMEFGLGPIALGLEAKANAVSYRSKLRLDSLPISLYIVF